MISQIGLIETLATYLAENGCEKLNVRQFNALVSAADLLLKQLESPHRGVTLNMGLPAWRASDETGRSSLYLSYALEGKAGGRLVNWPCDPDDFGRCVGLLVACPDLRAKLPLMADHGPPWDELAPAWGELEALWNEESPSGTCPKLFARMQALLGVVGGAGDE